MWYSMHACDLVKMQLSKVKRQLSNITYFLNPKSTQLLEREAIEMLVNNKEVIWLIKNHLRQ